jgi:hypothetical protein
MSGIFHVAVKIATLLGLAGFVGAVLFLTLRQILRRPQSVQIVLRIITFLFILCFAGMILGFVGYVIRLRAENPEASANLHQRRPCDGEWRISIDYNRLHDDTTAKYVGLGHATMTWTPLDQSYDVVIWVTVAPEGAGNAPLLTSVTRGTIEADGNGKPTASSMQLEYLAQTGRAPYDKPPFGKIEYTDLKFDWSTDGKRVDRIVGKYHSARTDAFVTFRR